MRTIYLLATSVLLLALPAFGKHEPKHYEQGMLVDVQDQRVNGPVLFTGNVGIPTKRTLYHITVGLGGILYAGEYEARKRDYRPNWIIGDPIEVRFENDRMFLKRPDGKELKTTIVRRARVPEGTNVQPPAPEPKSAALTLPLY